MPFSRLREYKMRSRPSIIDLGQWDYVVYRSRFNLQGELTGDAADGKPYQPVSQNLQAMQGNNNDVSRLYSMNRMLFFERSNHSGVIRLQSHYERGPDCDPCQILHADVRGCLFYKYSNCYTLRNRM